MFVFFWFSINGFCGVTKHTVSVKNSFLSSPNAATGQQFRESAVYLALAVNTGTQVSDTD